MSFLTGIVLGSGTACAFPRSPRAKQIGRGCASFSVRPHSSSKASFRLPAATQKNAAHSCGDLFALHGAVSEGFEPPVRCRTPVFEAGSFNHSDNSPSIKGMVANASIPLVWMTGLEPATSWSLTRCATNCATSRDLRRERDSNSRYPLGVHTLSRRASSATRASLPRKGTANIDKFFKKRIFLS